MISAEVLPPTFPLEDLRADWNRLYGAGQWEPSVSFGWSRAMIRNHLARDSNWFIVLLRRSGEITGIVPMARAEQRVLGRTVTTLSPIQERNNTHSDLLIRDYDPELLAAWLEALTRSGGRWDLLQLSRLIEDGPLCAALAGRLPRCGRAFELVPQQPSYFLPLPASHDDYLASRSAKFRNHLKRAEKKLAAAGACALTLVRDGDDFEAAYRELLAIEAASWKHGHGTAISAVPHQTGFYRDLAESALRAGTLHLTFLRVNGVAVAYNLGLVANDCYYYLKTSVRDEHKSSGAATVGRAWLIRQLIGDGLPKFDFPAEPYEWERQWTSELRWHRSLLVYNRTANAGLLRLIRFARALLRRRGERDLVHSEARPSRAET